MTHWEDWLRRGQAVAQAGAVERGLPATSPRRPSKARVLEDPEEGAHQARHTYPGRQRTYDGYGAGLGNFKVVAVDNHVSRRRADAGRQCKWGGFRFAIPNRSAHALEAGGDSIAIGFSRGQVKGRIQREHAFGSARSTRGWIQPPAKPIMAYRNPSECEDQLRVCDSIPAAVLHPLTLTRKTHRE